MKTFRAPLQLFALLIFYLCLGAQGGNCNKPSSTTLIQDKSAPTSVVAPNDIKDIKDPSIDATTPLFCFGAHIRKVNVLYFKLVQTLLQTGWGTGIWNPQEKTFSEYVRDFGKTCTPQNAFLPDSLSQRGFSYEWALMIAFHLNDGGLVNAENIPIKAQIITKNPYKWGEHSAVAIIKDSKCKVIFDPWQTKSADLYDFEGWLTKEEYILHESSKDDLKCYSKAFSLNLELDKALINP